MRARHDKRGLDMLKVALLAAAMTAAASTPTSTGPAFDPGAAPSLDAACRPGQSLELACALQVADANGDATTSPGELAALAASQTPAPAWTPRGTVLDFKDAAIDGGSILRVVPDRDPSQRLLPALFALGALVVLLRRRPT